MSSTTRETLPGWGNIWTRFENQMRNDPKEHGLNQLRLQRLADFTLLFNAAEIVNNQIKEKHPDKALPSSGWRNHLAYMEMGLGPAPGEAFLNPHGQEPGMVQGYYSSKLEEISKRE